MAQRGSRSPLQGELPKAEGSRSPSADLCNLRPLFHTPCETVALSELLISTIAPIYIRARFL